jgi:hypothetical protein
VYFSKLKFIVRFLFLHDYNKFAIHCFVFCARYIGWAVFAGHTLVGYIANGKGQKSAFAGGG